jgi:hypothetical protein
MIREQELPIFFRGDSNKMYDIVLCEKEIKNFDDFILNCHEISRDWYVIEIDFQYGHRAMQHAQYSGWKNILYPQSTFPYIKKVG